MKTIIVPFNKINAVASAKSLLREEQVIAAPTDTVYGVMCRYDSTVAISRLYDVKGRPPHKAIPVLIGMQEQLADIVRFPLDRRCAALMEKFWPGPLTLVLQARDSLPEILTAGQQTVAVRIPQHDSLRALLCDVGPLAVTSANLSGQAEAHSADEVMAQLGGRLPLILSDDEQTDGQTVQLQNKVGMASTILDLSAANGESRFLREGPIHMDVKQLIDETEIR